MDIEIKKTLWATADKLRSNMDAAEDKHLGRWRAPDRDPIDRR